MAFFCYEKNQFDQWFPCKWDGKPLELRREYKGDRSKVVILSDEDASLTLDTLKNKYPPPSTDQKGETP